jgi:hypothetical protein
MTKKEWRPKGWERERNELIKRVGGYFNPDTAIIIQDDIDISEAGADAMLEALLKMAKESPTGKFIIDSNIQCQYWRLVDIPDDEDGK